MSQILREKTFPGGQVIQITRGDLTQEPVDAIVNAANTGLQHGGGVAGVISRKGGPSIQAESDEWVKVHGWVSHSNPAITSAGNLPCKYVIHAVGPVWGSGDEDSKLSAAISGALRVAGELGIQSIALPAISTGIFSFPKDRAARIIFTAIDDYFTDEGTTSLNLVRLTLIDTPTVNSFLQVWDHRNE
jgi:O-acetyl-ADP-ribose deacetylase (regulator of RNase III)